jgi:hypothetical protein
MATNPTRPKLDDEVASVETQSEWINSAPVPTAIPQRAWPILSDEEYDDRLQYLVSAPEWNQIRTFLHRYISLCLFRPFATMDKWWNATIPERGEFVRINVGPQEVLVIDFRKQSESELPMAWGYAVVDAKATETARENTHAALLPFKMDKSNYADRGMDMIVVHFDGASVEQVDALLNDATFIRTARSANLHLMRAGLLPGNWGRRHVPKLIDAVFAEDAGAEGEAGASIADPETEYQRLVFLRANRTQFSDPVKCYWRGRCAVTGIEAPSLLEACHIKPFSDSEDTPAERLDPNNGLYLAAHVHAALDAHLIGISSDGDVRISERLSEDDRRRMNLFNGMRIQVTDKHRPYLDYRYSKFLEANKR